MSGSDWAVAVSAEAQQDLLDIWNFGANEWSVEQADRHLRDSDEMFERLRENPKLGRKRDDIVVGLRAAFVRPQFIYYRQSPRTITLFVFCMNASQSIRKLMAKRSA
jgi:toxin ParE1/3/4